MKAMKEFHRNRKLLGEWEATFLVLIPKKEGARRLEDFRPISLSNVKYKILTKVLANRLKKILLGIISPNQDRFVKGRQITDGIIVVHETVHSAHQRKEPGMIIKIDLSKAYNKVSWEWLMECMEAFGFEDKWREWMRLCISKPQYSVIINGTSSSFFSGFRGLRHGDPLSPYLFIISAELLGRATEEARRLGLVSEIKPTYGIDNIVHHQFVDDNIFLGKAPLREAHRFKEGLERFEQATNQKINIDKSSVFFMNTKERVQGKITRILDMHVCKLPTTYLGMPLFIGKMTKKLWNPILDRMRRKIAGLKGSLLSQVGKVQLVVASL